jgi:molecular chaperone GrpE
MTDEKTPGANGAGDQAEDEIGTGVEAGVEQLRAEMAEWRDKALRAVADAENTRRRAEREMNDARAYAIQRFAKDLLGAADNLERALAAAPRDSEDQAERNFVLGIEMTEKALHTAFERNGLKKIESGRGAKFDPHLHQAMMEQPDDGVEPGTIAQTFQPGYELYGRVIRPAMVVVAAKGASAASSTTPAAPVGSPEAANDPAPNPYAQDGEGPSGGSLDTKA